MSFLKRNKNKDFDLDSDIPEFRAEKPRNMPIMPNYEKEFGTIKKEVGRPSLQQPRVRIPEIKPQASPVANRISGDKPVFVKIDNYKEAMASIDKIKELINGAEGMLDEVRKIRSEEDKDLEKWHKNLDKVKEKLLDVDKKLFEL